MHKHIWDIVLIVTGATSTIIAFMCSPNTINALVLVVIFVSAIMIYAFINWHKSSKRNKLYEEQIYSLRKKCRELKKDRRGFASKYKERINEIDDLKTNIAMLIYQIDIMKQSKAILLKKLLEEKNEKISRSENN